MLVYPIVDSGVTITYQGWSFQVESSRITQISKTSSFWNRYCGRQIGLSKLSKDLSGITYHAVNSETFFWNTIPVLSQLGPVKHIPGCWECRFLMTCLRVLVKGMHESGQAPRGQERNNNGQKNDVAIVRTQWLRWGRQMWLKSQSRRPDNWDPRMAWLALPMQPRGSRSPHPGDLMSATMFPGCLCSSWTSSLSNLCLSDCPKMQYLNYNSVHA